MIIKSNDKLDYEDLYSREKIDINIIELGFKGYFREVKWDTLPDESAVYCIYACTYYKEAETVSIRKLLYIGESEQLKSRVTNPNHQGVKRAHERLRDGEVLCLSYAKVDRWGMICHLSSERL